MIHESHLKLIAHRQLKAVKEHLEEEGGFHPRYLIIEADGRVIDMVLPDPSTLVFPLMRDHIQEHGSAAAIMVCEVSVGQATREGLKHPQEMERIARQKRGETDILVERGWLTRFDAVAVTIHTPEKVTLLAQEFARDRRLRIINYGEFQTSEMPQADFRGREKMFGDLTPANLLED